jgi:hypothetical protein
LASTAVNFDCSRPSRTGRRTIDAIFMRTSQPCRHSGQRPDQHLDGKLQPSWPLHLCATVEMRHPGPGEKSSKQQGLSRAAQWPCQSRAGVMHQQAGSALSGRAIPVPVSCCARPKQRRPPPATKPRTCASGCNIRCCGWRAVTLAVPECWPSLIYCPAAALRLRPGS